jgi:hypothetical protein
MASSGDGLELAVRAGEVARENELVSVRVPAERIGGVAPWSGGPVGLQQEPVGLLLRDENGAAVAAQYDGLRGELSFILSGRTEAGAERRLRLDASAVPSNAAQVVQKLDRALFFVGGQPFASYQVLGARRPYVWPLLGPCGASVVRGQGTGDHPHHTGLNLTYGGHSEGGSSNIWSDWDEPPYGPGGRMHHRGFRRVVSGPVYGEVVHDLTYVNAYGDPIVDEVRTVRCWWGSNGERYMDFTFEVLSTRDTGPNPFFLAIRLPQFFGIPETGRITNSAGRAVPAPEGEDRYYTAEWIDASGPTGEAPRAPMTAPPEVLVDAPGYVPPKKGPGTGPWNGIALFDHPENNGYPNIHGKYAGSRGAVQMTQAHYPPESAPNGPFSFRHRVYVHDGDAEAAQVAARHASYAAPVRVEVG